MDVRVVNEDSNRAGMEVTCRVSICKYVKRDSVENAPESMAVIVLDDMLLRPTVVGGKMTYHERGG